MGNTKKWNQDHYTQEAKKQNFLARSVFKLQEIDKKFNVFSAGKHVLDLGCAPGSWLQYARSKCGATSRLTGVDIRPCTMGDAEFIEASVFEIEPSSFTLHYDIVMSDMAPSTSGSSFTDCMKSLKLSTGAWKLAAQVLKPGGTFVFKIFQSPDADVFIKELSECFKKVSRFKPQSTRQKSNEIYAICSGYAGPDHH